MYIEDNTYTNTKYTIKRYKWRRLQPTIFWQLWNRSGIDADGRSIKSLRYKMITLLVMQRFTHAEVLKIVFGWCKIHRFSIDHSDITKDIAAVKLYTLEERRRIKREEMQKYRAKQKAKTVVAGLETTA
jgi:hypothetical protein